MSIPETKQRYRDALARLVAGRPEVPEVAAALAAGKLEIGYLSVALEAKLSRTPISMDGTDYQDVRDEIYKVIEARSTGPRGETTRALIKRLRNDVAALRDELAIRDFERATLLIEQWNKAHGLGPGGDPARRATPAERKASLRLVPVNRSDSDT